MESAAATLEAIHTESALMFAVAMQAGFHPRVQCSNGRFSPLDGEKLRGRFGSEQIVQHRHEQQKPSHLARSSTHRSTHSGMAWRRLLTMVLTGYARSWATGKFAPIVAISPAVRFPPSIHRSGRLTVSLRDGFPPPHLPAILTHLPD